jgi:hypothetical protein
MTHRLRRLARLATAAVLSATAPIVVGAGPAAAARPPFQMPVPCGQVWTTSTHGGHASQYMVDMINTDGPTLGTPALASAAGRVTLSGYYGDAGNMVVIDHGGGWLTRYLHLRVRSVVAGDTVGMGQPIGEVGNTGTNTTGAHLHYEQRHDGTVVQAMVDGHLLPVTWSYHQHRETSRNCGGGGVGRFWVDVFADAPGVDVPGGSRTGTLRAGRSYVYCRVWGPEVRVGESFNHWWLLTDLDDGPARQWVSAYWLARWGNDQAKDIDGADIADCNEPYGAIGDKWRAMGGVSSAVGPPRHAEADAQLGGRFQEFWSGMIIWHPDTGAHAMYGAILARYRHDGSETRWGFPTSDEADAATSPAGTRGRYQYTQRALILWSPDTGAHVVHGAIHDAFAANGREAALGYPTNEETPHPDGNGVYQTYQNATIHWTPQQGTWITPP